MAEFNPQLTQMTQMRDGQRQATYHDPQIDAD
jgi:hypothetical protein